MGVETRTRKQYRFRCAQMGCDARAPWGASYEKALRKAVKRGWRQIGNHWICPNCAGVINRGLCKLEVQDGKSAESV